MSKFPISPGISHVNYLLLPLGPRGLKSSAAKNCIPPGTEVFSASKKGEKSAKSGQMG